MKHKHFSQLIDGLQILKQNIGSDPLISAVHYDSREITPGTLFVALCGEHTDGHRYIQDAVAKKAEALVVQKETALAKQALAYAVTPDTRTALSKLAANFYDNPSKHLYTIGVTGTDGKSSTVWFIHQLYSLAGKHSGFVSTASYQTADRVQNNPYRQSTPEAPEIHQLLHLMLSSGKRFAVIEATSHGLSQKTARLKDVHFDVGVFTNITHEHLEFHGTQKNYRSDKANLFKGLSSSPAKSDLTSKSPLATPRFAVLNMGDPNWKYFSDAARVPVYTYALNLKNADISASDVIPSAHGSDFMIHVEQKAYPVHFNLPGAFNIENLLAALATVSYTTEIPLPELLPFIPRLTGVKGRMHSINMRQPFKVIVDFAHTPAAYSKLLPFIRTQTQGRLICVFGSAGERDTAKRKLQGKVASEYCDLVILTDEDPRGEDSLSIIQDIARGCENLTRGNDLFFIPDRAQAVYKALSTARNNDTVLLLGKGHETSIVYKDYKVAWNEITTAEDILKDLGFKK
ncbi:MAG: UDP-N-acetylmuramoyl-L-alanyl-D-glutamate--2,6-diaminopimelate ligase [Spirochaetales bacterium]|nr:UDP-N-acetylmuramoyl-L-alanyl-D-glutamate--2,6-diaminopimelate ligase [Spirochaetales bacterium]